MYELTVSIVCAGPRGIAGAPGSPGAPVSANILFIHTDFRPCQHSTPSRPICCITSFVTHKVKSKCVYVCICMFIIALNVINKIMLLFIIIFMCIYTYVYMLLCTPVRFTGNEKKPKYEHLSHPHTHTHTKVHACNNTVKYANETCFSCQLRCHTVHM